jgi:hypothetical protein
MFSATAAVAGTLALVDATDGDNFVEVDKANPTADAPSWPNFEVEVQITNVTSIIGTVFSVRWNSSLFAFGTGNYTAGTYLDPAGAGGKTAVLVDHISAGEIGEMVQLQLAPTSPKTFTDPSWGLVMTLWFLYIGPEPTIGTEVTSQIQLVHVPAETASTEWTSDGTSWNQFTNLIALDFRYYSAGGTPVPPTASFTVSPTPPLYVGDTITFDGSASSPGFDGDDATPITAYVWDFGDGTNATTAGPVITHEYNATGTYSVCLITVAPGIPTYIAPGYVNTSSQICQDVSIFVKAATGIDVFTEDYRWPCYTTSFVGLGANESADGFLPQEKVTICAYVFYNGDPVQNKPVAFQVSGPLNPFQNITVYRTAFTSGEWDNFTYGDGYVCVSFRIPWPCNNSEAIVFGNWTVKASVVLPLPQCQEEICYEDTLTFKVGWMVTVLEVTTHRVTVTPTISGEYDAFKKCGMIGIKVKVHNNYLEPRMALLTATVYDDVGTPIATITSWEEIAPGDPVITLGMLHIPKWAYSGFNPVVYANAYYICCDESGILAPWGPEVVSDPFAIAAITYSDCAAAYPWDLDDDYCVIRQTMNGTKYANDPWPGRYWSSYHQAAERLAILGDHVVDVEDIRNAWLPKVEEKQGMTPAEAMAHILAAEAYCGFSCP